MAQSEFKEQSRSKQTSESPVWSEKTVIVKHDMSKGKAD